MDSDSDSDSRDSNSDSRESSSSEEEDYSILGKGKACDGLNDAYEDYPWSDKSGKVKELRNVIDEILEVLGGAEPSWSLNWAKKKLEDCNGVTSYGPLLADRPDSSESSDSESRDSESEETDSKDSESKDSESEDKQCHTIAELAAENEDLSTLLVAVIGAYPYIHELL